MATRPVVPRATGEGSIGTAAKHWGAGHFDTLPNWQEYLAESTGYGIVSGCEPTISGLTVTVAAGVVHLAGGTRKEIASTNITLDAADSTNPRIDLVYIDSTGAVAKITGTAAASPSAPALPSGGISVAQVSVAANATTGTLITTLAKNELPFVVDNVAELRASNFSVGRTVMTKGYYAVNDGGGAVYTIREAHSDVDDGGSIIILSNENVAEIIAVNDVINVKQFGAKGNDVNDKVAFDNALSYASNNEKKLIVPQDTYIFNMPESGVLFDIPSNSYIDFCGSTIAIQPNALTDYYIIDLYAKSNITVENIKIVGDKLTHTGTGGEWGFGLAIRGKCENIHCKNVESSYCWGDGVYFCMKDTYVPQNIWMDNIYCHHNRRNGFTITSGYNIFVNHVLCEHTSGTAPQAGFIVEPNTDSVKVVAYIDNVECRDNLGAGFSYVNPRIDNVELYVGKIECFNNVLCLNNHYLGSEHTDIRNIIEIDSVSIILSDSTRNFPYMVEYNSYDFYPSRGIGTIRVHNLLCVNKTASNIPVLLHMYEHALYVTFDEITIYGNYDALIENSSRQRTQIGTLINNGNITAVNLNVTNAVIGTIISPIKQVNANTIIPAFIRSINCIGTITLTVDVNGFLDGQKIMITNEQGGTVTVILPGRIQLIGSTTKVSTYTIPAYSMSEIMYIKGLGFFVETIRYTT